MNFLPCPRCGLRSYEKLKTHDHCVNCNYSSEFYIEPIAVIPDWAKQEVDAKTNLKREVANASAA
jgi:predicted nucleic-acid-binding Zn-ribbon protein